jgi:ssDNA-binding Zn-finger/Zn-ribbon topoisomerase 1
MAAAPKENLGKMPCPACGEPVALKKSATGKLSYACQDAECESTGYADQHTGAARKWLAALTVKAAATGHPLPLVLPAPTPTPSPTPAPVPAPEPKPQRKAFELGDL